MYLELLNNWQCDFCFKSLCIYKRTICKYLFFFFSQKNLYQWRLDFFQFAAQTYFFANGLDSHSKFKCFELWDCLSHILTCLNPWVWECLDLMFDYDHYSYTKFKSGLDVLIARFLFRFVSTSSMNTILNKIGLIDLDQWCSIYGQAEANEACMNGLPLAEVTFMWLWSQGGECCCCFSFLLS